MSLSDPTPPIASPSQWKELSTVALRRAIDIKGRSLPAGSKGTVVGVYQRGDGYEVEFDRPFHAVVTLRGSDLQA